MVNINESLLWELIINIIQTGEQISKIQQICKNTDEIIKQNSFIWKKLYYCEIKQINVIKFFEE